MTFIQSPRWAFRLWFVRFAERIHEASGRATRASSEVFYTPAAIRWEGFVERFSTFSSSSGYSNRRLRRLLYTLRFPRTALKRDFLSWLSGRVYWPSLGRFEGHDPNIALMGEWLVDEAEPTVAFGDWTEWLSVVAWLDYDVPWSSTPENWIGILDSRGFWEMSRYSRPVAEHRLAKLEREWAAYNIDDEYLDDAEAIIHEEDHYGD